MLDVTSSNVPVSIATTTQPTGDNALLDLLGMDLGPTPAVGQSLLPTMQQQQPHPPMETGLLDLLGDTSQPVTVVPAANMNGKSLVLVHYL